MSPQKEPIPPIAFLEAAVVLTGIILLKFWYRTAGADDLIWITGPVSKLTGLITGQAFVFIKTIGFCSADPFIVITRDCSGVNFLIIAASLAIWQAFPFPGRGIKRYMKILHYLLLSYTLTVAANASRIAASLIMLRLLEGVVKHNVLTIIHLAFGIFIYVLFLTGFYLLLNTTSRLRNPKAFIRKTQEIVV